MKFRWDGVENLIQPARKRQISEIDMLAKSFSANKEQ